MQATRFLVFVVLISWACPGGWTDSLFIPGFDGYLTSRSAVATGDIVNVQVDGASVLSFRAASSDAKTLTLEFSGGEFGNLFSFLPQARSGGEQTSRGRQEYELNSRFAARVTQVDPTGKARIEGSRSVSLEGKQESLSLSGWLDPADLGSGREVRFSQLADARLSFRTLLQPASPVLTSRDIQQILAAQPASADPAAAGPAATGPATGALAPAGAPAGPAAPRPAYSLTDTRKLDLFLRYVNRLIDLLFQP